MMRFIKLKHIQGWCGEEKNFGSKLRIVRCPQQYEDVVWDWATSESVIRSKAGFEKNKL